MISRLTFRNVIVGVISLQCDFVVMSQAKVNLSISLILKIDFYAVIAVTIIYTGCCFRISDFLTADRVDCRAYIHALYLTCACT